MSNDSPALVSKVWNMAHVLRDLLNQTPAGDEPEAPWPGSIS